MEGKMYFKTFNTWNKLNRFKMYNIKTLGDLRAHLNPDMEDEK